VAINIEYFVGAFIGILFMTISNRQIKNKIKYKPNKFRYSQSHIFEIVEPLLPLIPPATKSRNTQSYKHEEKFNVRVIIFGDNAYWVKENIFYTAKIYDNQIDRDSTSVVDIMSMGSVELDKMLFIIDQLRDGKE